MSKISVIRYCKEHQNVWNKFVEDAKNGTFILNRHFMDYHQELFEDHSVLLWQNKRLLAILPANAVGSVWHSHQGLSYGGLLWVERVSLQEACAVWEALLMYAEKHGFSSLKYKPVPRYYHQNTCYEDAQPLHWLGAEQTTLESNILVHGYNPHHWQGRRRRGVKKANEQQMTVHCNRHWEAFWEILAINLESRHGLAPVHSLEEIQLLHKLFPAEIKLFTVGNQANQVLGGVVIFETPTTAHAQYIASTEQGRAVHALDLLFDTIFKTYKHRHCVSLGVSTLRTSNQINKGLQEWKESWGGVTGIHEQWHIDTNKSFLLQNRFI